VRTRTPRSQDRRGLPRAARVTRAALERIKFAGGQYAD
jgi:hypothetical protein